MDEEYSNVLQKEMDNAVDTQEDQQELIEAQTDTYDAAYPTSKPDSNLYNLFIRVLKMRDSTKVANLKQFEIGNLNISVRDSQKIGMLGHIFHHPTFGDFFYSIGEITNSTSMSRDGWFSELFVSQKKFTTRARKTSSLTKDKFRLFGKKPSTDSLET